MRPLDDAHFYIDNAPPLEVESVLRCLTSGQTLSAHEIAGELYERYGFVMQKDKTYSPRRLFDLGLAKQQKIGTKLTYTLTPLGRKIAAILEDNHALYVELVHFLYYSGYDGETGTRKLLWTYRRCCEIVWNEGRFVPNNELAARILSLMQEEFPGLDFASDKGARFDSTAARRFYTWLRQLWLTQDCSSPFSKDGKLCHRQVSNHELVLLAVDHVYRARGFRYGDPVVLDEQLIDEIARVFFLSSECCWKLLGLAERVTKYIELRETFAGTAVTLVSPYTIERI